MSREKLQTLKERLVEINDIESAASILSWDQSTYMPAGGAVARGRQMATLMRLAQEKFINPEIGKLLDELQPYAESLPYESDDASLIRLTRRLYERALKIPPEFLGRFYQHSADTFQAWAAARPANDFASVRPLLEQTLDLSRQLAGFFAPYEYIADPLIDMSDYGMRAATVRSVFGELREQLVPLVQAITSQEPADDSCLHGHYPEAQQKEFGEAVVARLGYDFKRGRQDKTHHPFTTKFSIGDVRITTRFHEDALEDGLFSTIHEAGHAMYEQGINPAYEGLPIGTGTSAGVHESQSRTWENIVGRSRGFWEFFYPQLQATFPEQLKSVSLEQFYRAINKVARSLIRTDADEVTYNLHVMIRFNLELELLEGQLEVRHLPEVWKDRYETDLGIRPPDDRDGVLQDVHWFQGLIGGSFQGYTLGNIMGALFYEKALQAHPSIPDDMRQGHFEDLHGWLKGNIYQYGSKFTANELLQRITGGGLTIEPYIRYLTSKYSELYSL